MSRGMALGASVFGLAALFAGYVWVALEFPFAVFVPAAVGWYAVTRLPYGNRTALLTGLVGGVSFTGVFLLGIFMALTDGSPLALSAWLTAVLAAAVAGAATGWVLDRVRGSAVVAAHSAAGMFVATMVMGVLRQVAPASVDVAGAAQNAYFAIAQGLVGATVGAAIGAGVFRLAAHARADRAGDDRIGSLGAPGGV